MKTNRLNYWFATLLALTIGSGAAVADVTLPAPQQLVTMSIQQRLALFQSMQSLPTKQRDANLKALTDEINALSQPQKQEMAERFKAEFEAMPQDQQESVRQQLTQMQQAR